MKRKVMLEFETEAEIDPLKFRSVLPLMHFFAEVTITKLAIDGNELLFGQPVKPPIYTPPTQGEPRQEDKPLQVAKPVSFEAHTLISDDPVAFANQMSAFLKEGWEMEGLAVHAQPTDQGRILTLATVLKRKKL